MDVELRNPESHLSHNVGLVGEVFAEPFDNVPFVLAINVVYVIDPLDASVKSQCHGKRVVRVCEPGEKSDIGNLLSQLLTFCPSEDLRCSTQRCAGTSY